MKGKHQGNYNQYLEQRDKEFLKAYHRATNILLSENGEVTLQDALNIARCSHCSRFFVSEQRASEIIKSLDAYIGNVNQSLLMPPEERQTYTDPLRKMTYQRRRMYSHLYVVYNKLRMAEPSATHEELITMACATPCEEFYMTIDSARAIHGRIRVNMKRFGIISSRETWRIVRDMKRRHR